MAKRIFTVPTFTPTQTADTVAHANNTYMGITGGSATQGINILEIFCAGQATATTTNFNNMVFARVSTAAGTPVAPVSPNSDGPMDGRTAALALPPVVFATATTGPQRSSLSTLARLMLAFNPFGGQAIWRAAEENGGWGITGTGASVAESILSATNAFAGTSSAMAAHIIYEPL